MSAKTKAALVTGGAQRIGKAICLDLAKQGYHIALHYNVSHRQAQRVADQIRGLGRRCDIFDADLARGKAAVELFARVKRAFPGICLLVNNASIFEGASISKLDMDCLRDHLAVNAESPLLLIKEFTKYAKRGIIINMLDAKITSHSSPKAAYLLSKKILTEITQMAALEYAPHFRVNGICPGYILPPLEKENLFPDSRERTIPLKTKGKLDHVLKTMRYMINNDYLTGQLIFVDGGEHLL